MANLAVDTSTEIALLHEKVDRLTELLEMQDQRFRALEELQQDMIPIVNHFIKLTIDELAEIGTEFRLEDLLYLMKRLLRSTPLLLQMLDQLEAFSEMQHEVEILGKQVFSDVVMQLDALERKGYFAFATEGAKILENIVTEFSEEDVKALGDNIVLILKTVRNMTQPEIMSLANNAVEAIRLEGGEAPQSLSIFALMREMGDPKVRKGMFRLLSMVKVLADQPDIPNQN